MKNLLEKVGALRTEDGYVMDTPEFIELEEKVLEVEGNLEKTARGAIDTINLLLARMENKMKPPNPITDISACFTARSKRIGLPYVTYISEDMIGLIKKTTGCNTLKKMEAEYGKKFPESHPLKIKIVKI